MEVSDSLFNFLTDTSSEALDKLKKGKKNCTLDIQQGIAVTMDRFLVILCRSFTLFSGTFLNIPLYTPILTTRITLIHFIPL